MKQSLSRFAKLMMNQINIQKLRIINYKTLLNFDDDDDEFYNL